MQIHLAKPGGEKRGPYTLEQINRDLAAKKYQDTDYWAWYDGADAWVPLYSVPGISAASAAPVAAAALAEPEEPAIAAELQFLTQGVSGARPATAPEAAAIASQKSEASDDAQVSAGRPFEALEQIFIFTNGEGPALMRSPVATGLLQEVIGTDWNKIREKVPRDVFGRCDIGERIAKEGKVPVSAWRAMSAIKPALVQQARDGRYHTCIRTFSIETHEVVAVFLFYDKQKL